MPIQRIAVLTSGGDAAGMNATIRAVTRSGLERGWDVIGVRDGFVGLLDGRFTALSARAVGGIIQRGGTVLGSSRLPALLEADTQRATAERVRRERIDALVVIGGNGSQTGAAALAGHGVKSVGIASTIDNDVAGFDITLGADTALGVALEAIDRLKVTAASHRRISVVEVMGRDCGYLALATGIAGGAEAIVIPEVPSTLDDIVRKVRDAFARGQTHALIVVAEGAALATAAIVSHVEAHVENLGLGVRATILGHVQRGGTPGPFDRLLGSRLGFAAVHQLAEGAHGVVLGLAGGRVVALPFGEVVGKVRRLDPELIALELALTR